MINLNKLNDAEQEIQNLLNQNETNWKSVAKIAIAVQKKELFKQSGVKSFTAWIGAVAKKCDRQPSLIWRYIKAAKYYLHTVGSERVEDIDDVVAPPEALVNLEKVERNAPNPIFETLKNKVLAGEATVRETRAIEREYRPSPSASGNQHRRGRPKSGTEGSYQHLGKVSSEVVADRNQSITETNDESNRNIVNIPLNQIATTISRSLSFSLVDWTKKSGGKAYPASLYQDHTEVRVNLDRKRFRIDYLAVVRWSFKRPKDIFVVEIKSNLSDFSSDEKWQNYLNFGDYFCFAIPQHESELIEAIEVATDAGILLVDFHAQLGENMTYPVTVHRKPKKKTGKFKHLVYETLYERLLKWTERKQKSS